MTMQRSLPIVAAAVIAATSGVGVARADDDFRCGSRIVSVGMSQGDVLDACGEPATKDVEDVDVRSGNRVGVQFHPERSGAAGLRILGNFVAECAEATRAA